MCDKKQLYPGQIVNHTENGRYIFLATGGKLFYFSRGVVVRESELYIFDLVDQAPLTEFFVGVESAALMRSLLLDRNSLGYLKGGEVILIYENNVDKLCVVKSVDIGLGLITCTDNISYDVEKVRVFYTGFNKKDPI